MALLALRLQDRAQEVTAMPTQLVSLSPSAFVERLIGIGLPTNGDPVRLTRYVSGHGHNPLAVAVMAQLNQMMDRGARAADPRAAADLLRVRQAVIADTDGARVAAWRRVFTGQGRPNHLVAVWNYILSHRAALEALPAVNAAMDGREDTPALDFTWSSWFATGNAPQAMVRDAVFGYDCLGFIGNYLCAAGLRSDYAEYTVAQYASQLRLQAVADLSLVRPLCLLLWPGGVGHAQHIAIIDRVITREELDGGRLLLTVDLCQSSANGPQCNRRVMLSLSGTSVHLGGSSLPGVRMSGFGSPPAPVRGNFALMQHPDWVLTTAPG
jgi:hypothetical protein